jgi:hypothetical protein
MFAGRQPLVVSGFYVISTGVTIGTNLRIRVADSSLIHFLASESGSIFHVPADRPDEQLSTTNPRVLGGFTTGTVNYVGLDFVREADESTIDLVEFIDSDSELETPVQVPLARVADYRIVISTLDFENNPGVCPIAKVTLDDNNNITAIVDSRQGAFRLGSGGSLPNPQSSFQWPAGREENLAGDVFVGGDKAIQNFKDWMDAIMTRLWEVGGGEYWYSPTNYGNERLARVGVPFDNGEYFEWDGSNLHWKGLVWIFANSNAVTNVISDVEDDTPGLTDLDEGECIYVDVNRATGATLNAAKGLLTDLGTPETPGSRYVIAWFYDGEIYTRDQSYAVGSAFDLATVAGPGMVQLSATPTGAVYPAAVATIDDVDYFAFAGGLSRSGDFIGGPGDIQIGGVSSDDHNVILETTRSNDQTIVEGSNLWYLNFGSSLVVRQNVEAVANFLGSICRPLTLQAFDGNDSQMEDTMAFDSNGTIMWKLVENEPPAPPDTSDSPLAIRTYMQTNGLSTPDTRDQFKIQDRDGNITVLWESEPY